MQPALALDFGAQQHLVAGKAIKVGKATFHLAITPSGITVYVVHSIVPPPGARASGSVTTIDQTRPK